MPYISLSRRDEISINSPTRVRTANAGELNFCFTELIIDYLDKTGLSYTSINDIIGVLEGAKLEFYRRVALPYEDGKISENGDVYPSQFGGKED